MLYDLFIKNKINKINKMENLPNEVLEQILLNTHISDLDSLCNVSHSYRTICEDDLFWKNKSVRDLNKNFTPSLFNLSPKLNYYIQMALYDDAQIKDGLKSIKSNYDYYKFTKILKTALDNSNYHIIQTDIDDIMAKILLNDTSKFQILRLSPPIYGCRRHRQWGRRGEIIYTNNVFQLL